MHAGAANPRDGDGTTRSGLVAVLGASGRSGRAFCRALHAIGRGFVPVVRSAARWDEAGVAGTPQIADLDDHAALARALDGAAIVVSTAHARWTGKILAAAPAEARFVLMGSTRRFSRWPDAHGDGVRQGEAMFLSSGRPGLMLHPTLIYARDGEGDVQRLEALLRRLPFAPLPGGGRALVQPIHQDDVTRCLLAALHHAPDQPATCVIAGRDAVPYRDFVRAVALAAGLARPLLLPVPLLPLRAAARLAAFVPGLPRIGPDEIRRMTEDKAFDIAPMRQLLGVDPLGLDDGLAMTFPGTART